MDLHSTRLRSRRGGRVLIHFSYVDFRFRYREGMLWFWMLNPAPPLMWASRASDCRGLVRSPCRRAFIGIGQSFADRLW